MLGFGYSLAPGWVDAMLVPKGRREMNMKMPRGAIPTPRSELAASQPYRPQSGPEIFVPSGEFPTPIHELAAAEPYKPGGVAPESFLAWPKEIAFWGNDKVSNSSWAEEAFAKACVEPMCSSRLI